MLAAGAVTAVAVLQVLGPPRHAVHAAQAHPGSVATAVAKTPAPALAKRVAGAMVRPAGTIAPPDLALLAPSPDDPKRMLPVIGTDGRRPSVIYAAAATPVLPNQSRLALLVDGMGLDVATTMAAINELPPAVSLAFSPYATGVEPLEAAARAHGHEMLVSIPMEPQGSPQNDEGERQLSPSKDEDTNTRNLLWALSSLQGYVGATAAESGQMGEHVLGDLAEFGQVARVLAARGLMFVDPRANAVLPPGLPSVAAGSVIDVTADFTTQDAQLGALAGVAQLNGQTLGIVGPLQPRTLTRLVDWVRTLPALGIVLEPASSLATTPAADAAGPVALTVGQ